MVKFKEIPFSEQNCHPVNPSPDLCVNRALERLSSSFAIKRRVVWASHRTVGDMSKEKVEIREIQKCCGEAM